MDMVAWAKSELDLLLDGDDDGMQKEMNKCVLDIVKKFSKQGHSGFSAAYALRLIKRLLAYKPITPLTGDENEWGNVFDDGNQTQQNKRFSAVFRHNFDNSTAYYIDGIIFSDDDGKTWFTSRQSFVPVTFPYAVPDQPKKVILTKIAGEDEDHVSE